MKTGEFIELLKEVDPSGELELVVNAGCYEYPVSPSSPSKNYIDDEEWEWSNDEDGTEVVSFRADN